MVDLMFRGNADAQPIRSAKHSSKAMMCHHDNSPLTCLMQAKSARMDTSL